MGRGGERGGGGRMLQLLGANTTCPGEYITPYGWKKPRKAAERVKGKKKKRKEKEREGFVSAEA